ncbi:hypothetical protein MBAV_000273 [Candidatus Magnetobacterium bavaricum]|uniref:Uncharacterized protein n=1 Tax=Candidatus Magnetobacterium bavaricum TaxID=29290 RepID=A0A0F3H040_9BACT|nr:hypothetical protein MBAV_000273 [Candidatus Magnetobacterium bavaricum]
MTIVNNESLVSRRADVTITSMKGSRGLVGGLAGEVKEGQVRPGAPRSGAALLLSFTVRYKEDTWVTQI